MVLRDLTQMTAMMLTCHVTACTRHSQLGSLLARAGGCPVCAVIVGVRFSAAAAAASARHHRAGCTPATWGAVCWTGATCCMCLLCVRRRRGRSVRTARPGPKRHWAVGMRGVCARDKECAAM